MLVRTYPKSIRLPSACRLKASLEYPPTTPRSPCARRAALSWSRVELEWTPVLGRTLTLGDQTNECMTPEWTGTRCHLFWRSRSARSAFWSNSANLACNSTATASAWKSARAASASFKASWSWIVPGRPDLGGDPMAGCCNRDNWFGVLIYVTEGRLHLYALRIFVVRTRYIDGTLW